MRKQIEDMQTRDGGDDSDELAFAIVETRTLERPKTTMRHVWLALFGLLLLYCSAGVVAIFLPIDSWYRALVFTAEIVVLNESYLRFFGIVLIKAYQHYATDDMRKTCHCVPSCSEYSISELKKYPLLIAFVKIFLRLNKTCDGSYKIDKP